MSESGEEGSSAGMRRSISDLGEMPEVPPAKPGVGRLLALCNYRITLLDDVLGTKPNRLQDAFLRGEDIELVVAY